MTTLKVEHIDDENNILREMAHPIDVENINTEKVQILIDDMLDTMKDRRASGLAAPQIGINICLFVLMDGTVCINPEVKARGGNTTSYSEGCLSIPGKRYDIKRKRKIVVHCLDRFGESQTIRPRRKIYNIAIQHEIDHLNGVLVCDNGILVHTT